MEKDKIRVFILEILLIIFLFFALFALNIFSRKILALSLGIYAIIVSLFLKKRRFPSINKKQVTTLMVVFSMLYIAIFYLLGLYFGFERSKILFSFRTIIDFILPLSIIIISSEWIRGTFLSHKLEIGYKTKKKDLSIVFTYISMVIIDLLIYTEVYNVRVLDDFLTVLGFIFFSSLSCNLLYNYITNRYGIKGVIIFRLITVLFAYIIPIVPDLYIFFRSFLRMLYPYLIYLVFEKMFSKNDYSMGRQEKRKEMIGNTLIIALAAALVMLISCEFRYGIIVVGSESMTGTINKGDAVVFEKYTNQEIKNGQVIIFNYNNIQTIHRVVEVQRINGEYRYYTQGDANKRKDEDYRTKEDIYALVDLKVKYIGYPTLWVRELFS